MSDSAIIITNCTARKREARASLQLTDAMAGSTLAKTAERWKAALSDHRPRLSAERLYVGRGMAEAKRSAAFLNCPLWIASAGAGLVHRDTLLPPYNLTASNVSTGLNEVVLKHGSTIAEWWRAICGPENFGRLLADYPQAVVLVALPATYIQMVGPDMADHGKRSKDRLRIFTSPAGIEALPNTLREVAMPYDDRLESVPEYKGTRADFPQRALRHFVRELGAHELGLAAASTAVTRALRRFVAPQNARRTRVSDDDIKNIIRMMWNSGESRSSVLLRYVRDVGQIACEQGRFAALWRSVKSEMHGCS